MAMLQSIHQSLEIGHRGIRIEKILTSAEIWPIGRADVLNDIKASRYQERKQDLEGFDDVRTDMAAVVQDDVYPPDFGRDPSQQRGIVLASTIDRDPVL